MSQFVAATHPRRRAWEAGADDTKPAGHGQRGAPGAERALAPATAVVLRPDGRVPCADPAGLEPGSAVVDDGSRGHVGRRGSAATDRRRHRQLGRGPLTTSVAVVIATGAPIERPTDARDPRPVPSTIEVRPVQATCRGRTIDTTGHRALQARHRRLRSPAVTTTRIAQTQTGRPRAQVLGVNQPPRSGRLTRTGELLSHSVMAVEGPGVVRGRVPCDAAAARFALEVPGAEVQASPDAGCQDTVEHLREAVEVADRGVPRLEERPDARDRVAGLYPVTEVHAYDAGVGAVEAKVARRVLGIRRSDQRHTGGVGLGGRIAVLRCTYDRVPWAPQVPVVLVVPAVDRRVGLAEVLQREQARGVERV